MAKNQIRNLPPTKENVFKRIVRSIVNEELKTGLESFRVNILEAIGQRNYELRNDIAVMKDQIMGELQTARQEQKILSAQHQRVIDHEERLGELEKFTPRVNIYQSRPPPAPTPPPKKPWPTLEK